MAEVQPNNPAGRLYLLLNRGKGMQEGVQILDVWRSLLAVEKTPALLRRLGDVYALPGQIDAKVRQTDDPMAPDLYLRWRGHVQSAMDTPFHVPWQNFSKHLDPTTMMALEFCAHYLSKVAPEPVIDVKELAKIREHVEGVLAELREGKDDLPEPLHAFLFTKAVGMLNAIDRYALLGIDALREAFDSALGGLVSKEGPTREGLLKSKTARHHTRSRSVSVL